MHLSETVRLNRFSKSEHPMCNQCPNPEREIPSLSLLVTMPPWVTTPPTFIPLDWFCLFSNFISRILQWQSYELRLFSFTVMLLKFIPVVAGTSSSLPFIAELYPLYAYTVMYLPTLLGRSIWVASSLGPIWIHSEHLIEMEGFLDHRGICPL